MELTSWFSQTFLTLVLFVYFGSTQSSYINQDDWVDPDDVMNYDRVSKTMIKPEHSRAKNNEWVDPNQPECPLKCCTEHKNQVSNFQDRLSKCEDTIGNLLASKQTCPDTRQQTLPTRNTQANPVKAVETMYMKRFVNILLRVSGLNQAIIKPEDDALLKTVLISIKNEQLIALRRFGEDDKMTLGDLDNILSAILQSTESGFTIPVPVEWIDYFKHFFSSDEIFLHMTTWAIILVPLLMICLQRRYIEIIGTFLCLILVFGFQWKYNYMVKMAEVEQLIATQMGPPPECRPDLMTWRQSLQHALFGDPDSCRKYHKAQMVTPALAITPTVVLADLMADMITRSMEAIGQGIGRLSNGVLEGLPWYIGFIVLPLVLSLGAVIIVLLAGGSVGNMLFSLRGPRWMEAHQRVAFESVSGLPPAASLPTPNTPTVVHHIHHDGRDLAAGVAPQLASPARVDEHRLRAIDRRLAASPLRAHSEADLWIQEAITSGVSVRTPERDRFEGDNNRSTGGLTPSASQQLCEINGNRIDGGGDRVESFGESPFGSARSFDDKSAGKIVDKRFLTRDMKSNSREAGVLREIHSLLSDALQNTIVDDNSVEKSDNLMQVENESLENEALTLGQISEVPIMIVSSALSPESSQDLRTSNEGGADFLSRVVDVCDSESFSENASGNESSVIESEFITSIQNIASDDEVAS